MRAPHTSAPVRHQTVRCSGLGALLGAVLLAGGCRPEVPAAGPTVVLLTLDTTRADALGAYGHAAARTPTLDRLAREGALFLDVTAPAPTTLPSHASILTGLFPPEHGARNNGNFRLSPNIPTVPSRLAAAGWTAAAFVAAEVLSARYGLDPGFAHYDDALPAQREGEGYRERQAGEVVARALDWSARQAPGPQFLWLHFFEPHFPYRADPTHPELDPYDAEIARMDRALAELLEGLAELGRRDPALVVVGDHGEGRGDRGEDTHGLFVYQSTLRVPLIVHAPGRVPAGTRITQPVSSADVAPTLLALAGLPARLSDSSLSLLEYVDGATIPERTLYFETLLPRYEYLWSNLAGIRVGDRKFIAAPTNELYPIEAEAREGASLLEADTGGELSRRWRERFDTFVAGLKSPEESARLEPGADEVRALAALGYGFAPIRIDDGRVLPDPKDQLGDHPRYRAIQEAGGKGDWTRVLELTRAHLERRPPDAYSMLFAARARAELDDAPGAEALYQRLLQLFPEEPQCLRGLGHLMLATERAAEARSLFDRALAVAPLDAAAQLGRGDACLLLGDRDGARRAWEAALALDPHRTHAANNLGILAAQSGDLAQAARWWRQVLLSEPENANARANLERLEQGLPR